MSDDFLPDQCAAQTFDEVQCRGNLVSAIDGHVDGRVVSERGQTHTAFLRQALRFFGSRYAENLQSGLSELSNEMRRGGPRTEPDDHTVPDLLQRRKGGFPFQIVVHRKSLTRRRSSSSQTCSL